MGLVEGEDGQGLEALYRAYRPALLRILVARTGDHAEAEDVLQEMWIRLRQPAGGPIANGIPYLYRMALNLVVDRARARQRRARRERQWLAINHDDPSPSGELRDSSRAPDDAMIEQEEAALLVDALKTLPSGARQVFDLHKVAGLSHAEVAARLGISKSGVEKHMAVAMKYLRRAILSWGDPP